MSETNGISRLQVEQQKSLQNCKSMIGKWEKFHEDYTSVHNLLSDLPKKVTHEIMVPVGPLAYMPGKLIHTNEIMVLLGDNWFAERSASQAAEIAKRRLKNVEEYLNNLRKEHENILSHIAFTNDVANVQSLSDLKEIKEELSEKDKQRLAQKTKRVAHPRATKGSVKKVNLKTADTSESSRSTSVQDKLFARLEELERQEIMNNEMNDKNFTVNDSTCYIKKQDEKSDIFTEKKSTKRVKWEKGLADEKDKETVAFPKDEQATIKFTHSSGKTAPKENDLHGITSPGDIFNDYLKKKASTARSLPKETHQPRSILKSSNNDENGQKDTILNQPELSESLKSQNDISTRIKEKIPSKTEEAVTPAFADLVVERKDVGSSSDTTNKEQKEETRKISKFKAGRMKNK